MKASKLRFLSSVCCWFSAVTFAATDDSLRLDLRWESLPSLPDTVDQTALYNKTLSDVFRLQVGLRASESGVDLRTLSYKGEITYVPFSFVSLSSRQAPIARKKLN